MELDNVINKIIQFTYQVLNTFKDDMKNYSKVIQSYYWLLIDILIFSFVFFTKDEWISSTPEFYDLFLESIVIGFIFWFLWNSAFRDSISLIRKEKSQIRLENIIIRFITSFLRNFLILVIILFPLGILALFYSDILEKVSLSFLSEFLDKLHFSLFYIYYIPIFLISAGAFMLGFTILMAIVINKYENGFQISLASFYIILFASSYYIPVFSVFDLQRIPPLNVPFGFLQIPTTIDELLGMSIFFNINILGFLLLIPTSISLYLFRAFLLYGTNRYMNFGGYHGQKGIELAEHEALLLGPIMIYFAFFILLTSFLTFKWYIKIQTEEVSRKNKLKSSIASLVDEMEEETE